MNNISKSEKFKTLATKRTNDILNKIRILGNCSNKSVYGYEEEDIKRIFSAIEKELKTAKSKFTFPKKNSFKL